ncbi:MAG: precorrin-4 C(11)-methyltransferase [Tissierellia bacterium]|nr:precorrin-4 C(11)-methyltransferase [Tissierellia bacterium]
MISFVGAGPGDVELITLKGLKRIEKADIIIYAGSLVSEDHLKYCKKDAEFYNSAHMNLDEVLEVMKKAEHEGKSVVRLHTGDPSIYGAIQEQMDSLEREGIQFELIPGVSSFTAAAAAIKRELTLPGVSQTVILTRIAGRTPVPEDEDLVSLAKHKASMAIFLSVGNIGSVVEKLIEGYGSKDIPIAVVYKASWNDEKIVLGTLEDIEERVARAGIKRQAQILVGDFIDSEYSLSKLYDKNFSTGFRKAKK